jgi:hypothetical protein
LNDRNDGGKGFPFAADFLGPQIYAAAPPRCNLDSANPLKRRADLIL